MKTFIFICLCFLSVSVLAKPHAAFGDWPEGTSPKVVGARVVAQFLSAEPEDYRVKGCDGDGYGRGQWVTYPVVSLWKSSIDYAALIRDKELLSRLIAKFEPFYPGGEKADKVSKPRHVDFNVFGAVPLIIARLSGDVRARKMGLAYAEDQWLAPREDDLSVFPGWLKSHYVPPEKQRKYLKDGYSGQTRLWIDDMYMINLLQTEAYRLTNDRKYIDRAAKEMVLYLDKLQLENGLFNHAQNVPFRWARGNGWMAAGMPMILKHLKEDDGCYGYILAGYRRMMATLLKYQRNSGLWGQLVDDPDSWDETSGSLMFAYGFIMGCRYGWLDADVYAPAARRAYLSVVARLDRYGNVPDVCEGTGAESDRGYYHRRHRINGDPHGQAPLLWCVNELIELKRD